MSSGKAEPVYYECRITAVGNEQRGSFSKPFFWLEDLDERRSDLTQFHMICMKLPEV